MQGLNADRLPVGEIVLLMFLQISELESLFCIGGEVWTGSGEETGETFPESGK